jgi:serine/threonine protein kinase
MQLPVRFARYELQAFLGGGMSHVYQAVDTVMGRAVAVKILTELGIRDAEAKQRFLHEARLAGSIQHDHIVTVYDYGEEQGYPFMVLEFLRGEDLRDAIRQGHAGDAANRTRLALEVARALEFVHQRGIIHRDIKPENIFIEQSGRAKLMDFGIAKSEGLNLTKTGQSMGTPFYMAPEQVVGSAVTPLADVYSFGMVLYELFCGVKPVNGDTLQRLFYVILHEAPDREPLLAAGTPGPVVELIYRCIAKKPEERMPSFGAIAEILQGVLSGVAAPVETVLSMSVAGSAASSGAGPVAGGGRGVGKAALVALSLIHI